MEQWDEETAQNLSHGVFERGWGRVNDFVAIALSYAAVKMQPITLADFAEIGGQSGLDGPCWEPVEHLTDEQLADLRDEYEDEGRPRRGHGSFGRGR
jgi:hypothetical protein